MRELGIACLVLVVGGGLARAQQRADGKNAGSAASAPAVAGQTPALQAQPVSPPPSQTADKTKNQEEKSQEEKAHEPSTGTSNDRLLFALPNFLTLENGANVSPLTARQKFKVVARGSFDYVQIPWYGFQAGLGQANDNEASYGQGAVGYGKRFAAAAADGTIENFMTGAIFPTLFREDPRYFQSGKGSFLQRAGYSVSRTFVTRTDSGHTQFNISEIFGSALAASVSTYSYHPREDKTISNTAKVWGTQVAYDTLTIVIKEFWPDIRRAISKKK